jgi:nitrogen-specific signal transduction histidine kinase
MVNMFRSSTACFDAAGLQRLRNCALLLVDETLSVIHANAHAEQLLGVRIEALLGAPVCRLFHDRLEVDALLENTLRSRAEGPRPTCLLRKARCLDAQALWQIQLHRLEDKRLGTCLLLQMKKTRAIQQRDIQPKRAVVDARRVDRRIDGRDRD